MSAKQRRSRKLSEKQEHLSEVETREILKIEPDILKKLTKAEAEIKAGKYEIWKGRKR